MAFKIGEYSFTGPVASIDRHKDKSCIYVIVCKVEGEYFLLDIIESSKLRIRGENTGKMDCWIKHCNGQLMIFVHNTPLLKQQERIIIEQELRALFQPACKTDKKIWFPEVHF